MSYPDPNINPDEQWKKHEVAEYYETLTPGQKKDFNQAVKEFHDWQNNPDQGWFGVSITPARIKAKIQEISEKYNTSPGAMSYNAYPLQENKL